MGQTLAMWKQPIIPELGRQRLEDLKFKVSVGYIHGETPPPLKEHRARYMLSVIHNL